LASIENLAVFVKENFPTGLTWNVEGEKAESFIGKSPSAGNAAPAPAPAPAAAAPAAALPAPSAGVPPPPPPPPPPMIIDSAPPAASQQQQAPTGGAAAVFAEINRGESVTANLRKVDKSEMTHKNPNLRAGSIVSAAPGSPPKRQGPPTPNKPDKYTLKKAAKTSLEANKWVVENHEGNREIVIDETAINQAVYIYNCKNSTIRIKGKVNAVTMDSCTKCGIAVDSTVSTVDIVNCKSFALQVFKVVPTIAVDKCDSGEIYLNKDCLGVEILSAKSTALNVLVPEDVNTDDSEFKEVPVPEQFKTTIVNGKLVTSTVEHTG
jgi:adenylyl cyclase-associated protein